MTGFPALELLMRNYLDQTWDLRYFSVWAAVEDFSAREAIASQLEDEIAALLVQLPTEDDVEMFLVRELDSSFHPYQDGFTVREWLTAVAARPRRSTGPRPRRCGDRPRP